MKLELTIYGSKQTVSYTVGQEKYLKNSLTGQEKKTMLCTQQAHNHTSRKFSRLDPPPLFEDEILEKQSV